MYKKIILLVIGITIVIGVSLFVLKKDGNEVGSFYDMDITIKGYTIKIHSKEDGHPSRDTYFRTSFDITNKKGFTSSYFVDFVDLALPSENRNNGVIDDIVKPKKVVINNKKFDYYLDQSSNVSILYYLISDDGGQLIINVTGGDVFDSKGNLIKDNAIVDEGVLKSDELADILNFSIKKN